MYETIIPGHWVKTPDQLCPQGCFHPLCVIPASGYCRAHNIYITCITLLFQFYFFSIFNLIIMANSNSVTGSVRQLRERQNVVGNSTQTVWSFRLERYDENDEEKKELRPIAVEMVGQEFTGAIAEGDKVTIRLNGQISGGIIRTNTLFNETTNSVVKSAAVSPKSLIGIGVVAAIFIIIAITMFASQKKAAQQATQQLQNNAQQQQQIFDQHQKEVEARIQATKAQQEQAAKQIQKQSRR